MLIQDGTTIAVAGSVITIAFNAGINWRLIRNVRDDLSDTRKKLEQHLLECNPSREKVAVLWDRSQRGQQE